MAGQGFSPDTEVADLFTFLTVEFHNAGVEAPACLDRMIQMQLPW